MSGPNLKTVIPGFTELIVRHSNGDKKSMVFECNPAEMQKQIERSRKTGWIRYRNGTLWAALMMADVSVIACRTVHEDWGIGKDIMTTKIATPIWDED